jgi:choline dehydrogenase
LSALARLGVLANRLSEDPESQVLLLEARPQDKSMFIHMPAGVYRVWQDPKINWNYSSEAEAEMNGRNIYVPRGKVIGGSSSINTMVYLRGHPNDYDAWAEEFGLPEWDYAHCLPYFKKSERSERGESPWHGSDGPLGVSRGSTPNVLYDAFVKAGAQSGIGSSEDLNGYNPEGLARYDSTKWGGKRCSAAVAYLHPVVGRSNLTVITGAHAQRVLIINKRATGVEFSHNGTLFRAPARKEVLLCGGAINSPQLLMLSGIGPAAELTKHGIDTVLDVKGVGQNLQDHIDFMMQWACTLPVTLKHLEKPLVKLAVGVQWMLNKTGLVASNIWEAGGVVRTDSSVKTPNIQFHFAPVGLDYSDGKIKLKQGFQIHVSQLRQQARGRLELRSKSASDAPRIIFNFLSRENDKRELEDGLKIARHIVSQPVFDKYRGKEVYPGSGVKTDKQIRDYVQSIAETEMHPAVHAEWAITRAP